MAKSSTNKSLTTRNFQTEHVTSSFDEITNARRLTHKTTTTIDDQHQREQHQRKKQNPMMPNESQATVQHVDTRRHPRKNTDLKPRKSNRCDALADDLIEGGITFYQSDTTNDKTTTNQRPTLTTDATNARTTDIIDFHSKTNLSNSFELSSKIKVEERLSANFKVLSPKLQFKKT